MISKQIKQQIALLKKEGINRIICDVLKVYIGEIKGEQWEEVVVAEQATEVCKQLINEYKSQLPKKVVKVKQKTLQEEIDQVYKERGNIKERFNNIANGRD